MKNVFLSGLSSVILLASATLPHVAIAQTTAINSTTLRENSTNVAYLQPFNLVSLGYQGYLKEQGIPSGSSLILDNQIGRITAVELVQAAINANRLPAQILNDKGYLKSVDVQLASLRRNANSDAE
ncbi:hypothetical protein [Nostoc sp. MS1]|uniref:hypothetical protein n=1 Tax=Nostoc sp. MS1 TaxID=2764711 RepID=UPI001CC541C6|nr:hypothetical protein [Nostoc sp. MS1]BCL34676.1 hypothetical protein NSMS1_11230 [Nostoc sp. MS1]